MSRVHPAGAHMSLIQHYLHWKIQCCACPYQATSLRHPFQNQSNNGKTKAAEEGWFVKSTEVYPIYFNVSLFLKEYISDFAVRGSIAELINALVFILCGPWKCILKLKPMLSGYLVLDQSWSTDLFNPSTTPSWLSHLALWLVVSKNWLLSGG